MVYAVIVTNVVCVFLWLDISNEVQLFCIMGVFLSSCSVSPIVVVAGVSTDAAAKQVVASLLGCRGSYLTALKSKINLCSLLVYSLTEVMIG